MPCRVNQDGWVMVESFDKMWSTGEGNGKPLQYSCLKNPMNSLKLPKYRTLKYELPRLVGDLQYATEINAKLTPERIKNRAKEKIKPNCGRDW